jgi:hypothetical protein
LFLSGYLTAGLLRRFVLLVMENPRRFFFRLLVVVEELEILFVVVILAATQKSLLPPLRLVRASLNAALAVGPNGIKGPGAASDGLASVIGGHDGAAPRIGWQVRLAGPRRETGRPGAVGIAWRPAFPLPSLFDRDRPSFERLAVKTADGIVRLLG